MKLVCFLIVVFSSGIAMSQPFLVKDINAVNPIENEKYIFPKVFCKTFPASANKINKTLRLEILNADTKTPDKNIFEKVWQTKDQNASIRDISYKVLKNNNSLFSLEISAEGCGAYCEGFARFYTFNAKSGNKITLDSILTKKGLLNLVDSVNAYRKTQINNKLRSIEETLKQNDAKTKESYVEMKEMYTQCLDNNISVGYVARLEYKISDTGLIIYSSRCSAHANMALDELWEFEYELELKSWTNYLTKYGNSLIKAH